jgi:plastocyanin
MAIDTGAKAPARGLARWTRLGMLGQLFVIAGALVLLVAIVGFGLSAEGEQFFLLIVSGIALAGLLAAWKLGVVGKIVGVVTALFTAMALFWTAFGLEAFPSFFDVMPGVLVIPGALLAVVSYIAAIVAGRRANRSVSATGGERTAIRVALAIVGVVAIVTGAMTVVGRSTVDPGAADASITLSDFEFDEAAYRLEPGSTVRVKNTDPLFHTFTVDELDIDVSLTPGDEALVQIPDEPGEYVLYCRPHTETPDDPEYDSDMAARLTIG